MSKNNTFNVEDNVIWYKDNNYYIEIASAYNIFWDYKAISVEISCEGIEWEEYFPEVFIEKKNIETVDELIQSIIWWINYINELSDVKLSPVDNETIVKYAQEVFKIYNM